MVNHFTFIFRQWENNEESSKWDSDIIIFEIQNNGSGEYFWAHSSMSTVLIQVTWNIKKKNSGIHPVNYEKVASWSSKTKNLLVR